ncbi:hypothetical protein [Leptospira noguchii]|uniref:Lipoprotein n=3 Tax=Leptospira noguchii TaxID=28182 RepID=T0FN26_9LEPT|nr:hypothetical protein [Leptospira noguchii]EMO55736.1 hypothetical protein LEP1GSC172_0446 [Leptospira noguchii]EQA70945.1 hypothetical protein LEP1GSC059_3081 [Leptospira noguchii serovar Panama str. CZ214]
MNLKRENELYRIPLYFSGKRILTSQSLFYVLTIFFFIFVQCSPQYSILGNVFVRKGFVPEKKVRHVVFPVRIRSAWLLKSQNVEQKKFFESRSYEKLELAILGYGGKIQEKYKLEKLYRSEIESENLFNEEKGIQIAKQLDGDVAVFTEITDYGTASGNSVLEVTIKAIEVDKGEVVWKAIYSGKALGLQDNIDLSILESEIFEHLTEKLKNKTE